MALVSTRSYEDLLGDALEQLLAKGCETPPDFVTGLNELNVHGPAGQDWTEELFCAEMRRLGS